MPFDALDRVAPPSLIYPIHAYPRAKATHVVASRTLDASYWYAQQHNRNLGGMFWAWNGRAPTNGLPTWLESTTLETIYAPRYTELPSQITHVVAMVYFRVGVSAASGLAPFPYSRHAVALTNGTVTDTGDTVVTAHPTIPYSNSQRNRNPANPFAIVPFAGTIDPVNPFANVYRVGCFVALDNMLDVDGNLVTGPYTLTVTAHAANETGTAIAYSPVAVNVWWETHG